MNHIIEIDKDKNTHLIFATNQKSQKNVEPLIELYKGKLFSCLIKMFTNDCIGQFGTHIFSIKKSYSRTLTNLLSCWIFSLYINYDFSGDYFLPNNYSDTKSLENILRDFCKYDTKIIKINEKINKVTENLKTNYNHQLELLNSYSKSEIYKRNKTNYKIRKYMVNIIKNKKSPIESTFYKLQIIVAFAIKDKRLLNVLNNILIPIKIYDKLVNSYKGPIGKIDEYLWAIIFRYQLLGSNNHQLAVLPNIMESMTKDYNLNFECFASTINSTYPMYCSIYYDLEKYFGSVGSFFNITPIKGTFGFNPPYQKDIIELGINRLFEFLNNSTESLTFIITIPIWDNIGRNYMKELYSNELEKQNIEYGDFQIVNDIRGSKYFKGLRMIPKEKFTYIDHNFELYKNKTIQNTYVIILSNSNQNMSYMNTYDFETFPEMNIYIDVTENEFEL
jgi:hypothetical protein